MKEAVYKNAQTGFIIKTKTVCLVILLVRHVKTQNFAQTAKKIIYLKEFVMNTVR